MIAVILATALVVTALAAVFAFAIAMLALADRSER